MKMSQYEFDGLTCAEHRAFVSERSNNWSKAAGCSNTWSLERHVINPHAI